jgi:hypothetical protein
MMNIRERNSILFSPILTKEPSSPCSFSVKGEVEGERELLELEE